ncbi:hypothetical protein [Aquimarina pacifica]|uniref:hypothetical protein n=1 Tax=Aquimarina pacifica TaxID=1296415 RepID=UPI000471D77D|nr:hypothetical protein [Aquimarina pacifica]
MQHPISNTKTQKVKFGYWPLQESIKTTIQLVSNGDNFYSIYYSSECKGIGTGVIENITVPACRSIKTRINGNPEIEMHISNLSPSSDNLMAIHIRIDAEIRVLGTQTIYDQTLGTNDISIKNNKFLKSITEYFQKAKSQTNFSKVTIV